MALQPFEPTRFPALVVMPKIVPGESFETIRRRCEKIKRQILAEGRRYPWFREMMADGASAFQLRYLTAPQDIPGATHDETPDKETTRLLDKSEAVVAAIEREEKE